MLISQEEQETSINYMRNSDECIIYTSDPTVMTKLDKLVANEEEWSLIDQYRLEGKVVGKKYKTTKSLITFRSHKNQNTRVMSDEEKAAAAERLRLAREKRNNG